MSEKLYGVLQKVLRVPPNITPFSLDWYIEILKHIRDIILEDKDGLRVVEEAVEEWASWREKNVEIGLQEKLWEIKREIWQKRAEKYGWEHVSTAVVREFVNELAKVVKDGNIGKVAEIFRLLELALEKNKRETVWLLIEYIDHFYGDIDSLIFLLKKIISSR
jgi:alpha-L-arabinofuranosidase